MSRAREALDERIAAGAAFGFYRPYDRDREGVAPERWHLSHVPTAKEQLKGLTEGLLRQTTQQADMLLKQTVLDNLDEIYQRFVINVNPPPA